MSLNKIFQINGDPCPLLVGDMEYCNIMLNNCRVNDFRNCSRAAKWFDTTKCEINVKPKIDLKILKKPTYI